FSYMGEHVKDQTIVITTTNGTQAISAAREAYKVVIGSFLNLDSLCQWLSKQDRNVLLLCSGWKNKFNLEDALFAGAATAELIRHSDVFRFGDACIALMHLYEMAKNNPYKFLNHSFHKERLARLNLKDDIRYCLTPNQTTVIPVLRGEVIVNMEM